MISFPRSLRISSVISRVVVSLATLVPGYGHAESTGDRWAGWQVSVTLGPNWRSTTAAQRDQIPKTLGVAGGLEFRRSFGSTFFVGAASELAITSQMGGRTDAAVGDWSATQIFPVIPLAGVRLSAIHLSVGYPLRSQMVLLAESSGGEEIRYSESTFYQAALGWETGVGLFGARYRWGTYKLEKIGQTSSGLEPATEVADFTLLFTIPLIPK